MIRLDIPTTISPHSTSHVLSVPTQTAPYMADPTNHCNPQPTTLCQLFNIIDISCDMYISLLSYIPTIIPTTISPYPTPPVLPPLPPDTPYMADSTESASALPYHLAVPSPNPTQPTQYMPQPTLLYPYYHPHYHLTLPCPSRAPTTTSANPTYGRFYCPCNPQPTTLC